MQTEPLRNQNLRSSKLRSAASLRSEFRRLLRSLTVPAAMASCLAVSGYSNIAIAQESGSNYSARGKDPIPVSVRTGQDFRGQDFLSGNSRDEQYAQIAQEVDILERQQSLLRRVVRLVAPTVVHIEAIKEEQSNDRVGGRPSAPKRIEEAGSGVIVRISDKLIVLTNRHVIHGAPLQTIHLETSDGGHLTPVRVLEDPSTDVAVIEIEQISLPVAKMADSRMVDIGDFVFAVGSPFGLNHSVSYGIVSAKGRRNLELGSKSIVFQDFIQTDAAINPGNSGGPLMNMRGEVVGINTAIASNSGGNEGIGFAIPINLAINVATQLIERGEIQRAYLGVSVEKAFNASQGARSGSAPQRGAFVKVIKPNSPAESAGLKYGDVIVEFDGTEVDNDEHLVQLVGLTSTAKAVDVIFLRENQKFMINVQLVPIPGLN